ncbi:protein-L-isoaspartate O-methyltransferase [Batrachochytrium salamandrivorans]|nr:protein-L-isoaspartate O-methyltransferase [Batrachochytrium salamandrivorans]
MAERGNRELVQSLKQRGLLKTKRVIDAFLKVDRGFFLPLTSNNGNRSQMAYLDEPVICVPFHLSAPHIYAVGLEALNLSPGMSFLNLGSGTGYLSFLVAMITGEEGVNHAVERNPVLVDHSRKACKQHRQLADLNFIDFQVGDAFTAADQFAHQQKYDRIYVGAGCTVAGLERFQDMLQVGGRMIIPVESELLCVVRESESEFASQALMGVNFLKLIEQPAYVQHLTGSGAGAVVSLAGGGGIGVVVRRIIT